MVHTKTNDEVTPPQESTSSMNGVEKQHKMQSACATNVFGLRYNGIENKRKLFNALGDAFKYLSNQIDFMKEKTFLSQYEGPILLSTPQPPPGFIRPETTAEAPPEVVILKEVTLPEAPEVIPVKTEREIEDELLAQEESLQQQLQQLRQQGMVSETVAKRAREPKRNRTHWDFLLLEMKWLAKDFKKERRWKLEAAAKNAKGALKHAVAQQNKEKRRQKEEEERIRKKAAQIARVVKKEYWSKISKIVSIHQQSKIEETKQKFSQKKRDYLVKQTETFSKHLSEQLQASQQEVAPSLDTQASTTSAATEEITLATSEVKEDAMAVENTDQAEVNFEAVAEGDEEEFEASDSEEDDEATLDEEEKDVEGYDDELAALQQEADVSVEAILQSYQKKGEESGETTVAPSASSSFEDDAALSEEAKERKHVVTQASAVALSFQPTGYTLQTTKVKTKVPPLINQKFTLREYQQIGVDWLVTMYEKGYNGILADEMGLGKTIQTITTLAYIAYEKQIWGQHLVVVPSSVMLNWEMEFKKWCPGFKILTYYGNTKERKQKRIGWNDPETFNVCITSYNLVVKDKTIFKRKKWHYMILDEAHHIKNFKSQVWQTLLNFNTEHRLLLTGTPLQNNVMELWSLMHFLMPQLFQSHSEFKDWFSNPLTGMIEGSSEVDHQLIARLHTILRPFILRRLKSEVEKQLPKKTEKIVRCKLSKRQRNLYEDFMSRADTRSTLISTNVFKIINVLMQLRKVCDHPDLFEPRPIISSFQSDQLNISVPSLATRALERETINLSLLGLKFIENEFLPSYAFEETRKLEAPKALIEELPGAYQRMEKEIAMMNEYASKVKRRRLDAVKHSRRHLSYLNHFKCNQHVTYGSELVKTLSIHTDKMRDATSSSNFEPKFVTPADLLVTPERRLELLSDLIEEAVCIIPKVRSTSAQLYCCHPDPHAINAEERRLQQIQRTLSPATNLFWRPFIRSQMYFPDKRLLQFDCGKLQKMATLLKELQANDHRVLIFTQMSKMLDILEAFLSMNGYTYFRLDGQTKLERRQYMMERFNTDRKIFAFILSTRSGGLGINLTGADTVIFYDSDWNPAMDAQAQDRCHRIGQTKDVTIYRLVSESTVEERILVKATQKKQMSDIVMQGSAGLSSDFFKRKNMNDILGVTPAEEESVEETNDDVSEKEMERMLTSAEDTEDVQALKQAKSEENQIDDELNEIDPEAKKSDDDLLPIHKYGIAYLQQKNSEQLQKEIEEIEEEERQKEEDYRLELDSQQQKIAEQSNGEASLFYEARKKKSKQHNTKQKQRSGASTPKSARKRKRGQ